ncbi:hypothetical protein Rs2_42662 [Raphanus sativus]|nr:hypothetical protein Rs2_42662 [Raphanus sativus]
MKRKPNAPSIQMVNSTKGTERKARRKHNDGKPSDVQTKLDRKREISLDIPLPSVFKRLYEGVGHIPVRAVPSPANQGNSITPCTPTNNRNCYKSMYCGTGQPSTAAEQRSCVTSLANKSGVRKRPRTGLQFACNSSNFMDRLEEDIFEDTFQSELSGDDSEEDWDPSAYDSDFADKLDENVQANLVCSSQETQIQIRWRKIEVLDSDSN